MMLCPQLAGLCLGFRRRTTDVQVLIGLWGFRMTQGTQLPKEMRSFHTAEPEWFFLTSPPSSPLHQKGDIRERKNAHSQGLGGPEGPRLGDTGVKCDLCFGSCKRLRHRVEGTRDQSPTSAFPQPVCPWPRMALALPATSHQAPG